MWNLKSNTNESIYKTETDSDIEHKFMVNKRKRKEEEGQIRNVGLRDIHYYI